MQRCDKQDSPGTDRSLFLLLLSLPSPALLLATKIDIMQAEISLILSAHEEEEAAEADRGQKSEERRIRPEETIKYSNNLRVSYKLKRIAIKNSTPVSSVFTSQKPQTHTLTYTLTNTYTLSDTHTHTH